MNEELKQEFEELFVGRICNGYGESDPDTRVDIWEWIEQKLKQAYLQGAKDAIAEIRKFNKRNAFLMQEPTTKTVEELEERLAQQFIDSLEKGTTNE